MADRRYMEVERALQVRGDFALFSRVDSGRDRNTYLFPTPGADRGLAQTVYHTNRLEFVPLRVEILSKPKVVGIKRTNLKGIVYGGEGRSPIEQAPDSSVYLYDVHYRITYMVAGPADDIQRWDRRAQAGAFGSPPFLGTRECLAHLVPVDDTPPVDVTFHEPAMPLSNNCKPRRVDCVNGVVTYPPETREALRNRRRGSSLDFMALKQED